MELFTQPWQQAWHQQINNSESYKVAAKNWHGALILQVEREGEQPIRLFLDLHEGESRGIRDATSEDTCRFELTAPRATWLDLLNKGTDPIYLIMRGKLKLVQGSKAQLLPYAKAAKEMLQAARQIEGVTYE